MGSKEPLSAGVNQGEVPGGNATPPFGPVSVEAIQEMGEILILADIYGRVPQFVSNG